MSRRHKSGAIASGGNEGQKNAPSLAHKWMVQADGSRHPLSI
jgi:hypothetical protein